MFTYLFTYFIISLFEQILYFLQYSTSEKQRYKTRVNKNKSLILFIVWSSSNFLCFVLKVLAFGGARCKLSGLG